MGEMSRAGSYIAHFSPQLLVGCVSDKSTIRKTFPISPNLSSGQHLPICLCPDHLFRRLGQAMQNESQSSQLYNLLLEGSTVEVYESIFNF
jgi:hypothetical protein